MSSGILAHLSRRIAKQNELLATEGLTYLLNVSPASGDVLRRLVRQAGCELPPDLSYRSEVVGEALERPDIAVTRGDGAELGFIEGKFDAGLTENQPGQYLVRLGEEANGFLLFIVPERRRPKLWHQVFSRAAEIGSCGTPEELSGAIGCSFEARHALIMTSWRELLALMAAASSSRSEACLSDIHQLQHLCEQIEDDAFMPFSLEELTSVTLPRRNFDLCNLVDAIVEDLQRTGHVSLKGLRATGTPWGYVRYICLGSPEIGGFASIALNYDAWRRFETSPLWLAPQDSGIPEQAPVYRDLSISDNFELGDDNGRPLLPLPVDAGLEIGELVKNCRERILRVLEVLEASASERNANRDAQDSPTGSK